VLELGEINPFGGTDETAQPLKICSELPGEAIPPLGGVGTRISFWCQSYASDDAPTPMPPAGGAER